ncbi:MAG: hypothetical protein JSW73_01715 [Candidatus Woesearchaeota archaeon]|nr:MAG: hypothetical protein JSW73_01715 [Candidatus Woesearchaeota archaeon]
MPDENKKIDFKNLRKNIATLSSELKNIGSQKRTLLSTKRKLDKEISDLISSASENKEKKGKVDVKVRDLKKKRDIYNKKVKESSSELKKEKAEKVPKQAKDLPSPEALKKQIEELELKIETEPLAFNREKQYMDKIRKLRAAFREAEEIASKFKNVRDLKQKLMSNKKLGDELHVKVQKLADESSELFKNLKETSEIIAKKKKERNDLSKKIKEINKKTKELSEKLEKALKEWAKSREKVAKREKRKTTVKIEDAFKDKKKLTTEDILKLQRRL